MEACREVHAPEPQLRYESTGLWIEFSFLEGQNEGSGKMSGKMSGKIVESLLERPNITIPELAQRLKRTNRTVERLINRLKADGFIKRIGPAKVGHWEVLK
jgi:ATP-dependent DNA helicase RecG